MDPSFWLIGSNNIKKAQEMAAILQPIGVKIQTPRDISLVLEVDEWGANFQQNATLKALAFAAKTRGVCVADDSGLSVDGLDGAPGVHSARYAGPNATDADNNRKLQEALQDKREDARRARYHCSIAIACAQSYTDPQIERLRQQRPPLHYRGFDALDTGAAWAMDSDTIQTLIGVHEAMNLWLFSATWEGTIGGEPKGEGGFGYDPWFVLADGRHVAELPDNEKNQRSHRAQALRELDLALRA